jgi:homoserine kinase
MDVEVQVPATIANLGPGFDCLGVAVAVHLRLRISPSEKLEIEGKWKARSPADNLTYRAFNETFESAGKLAPPVRIETLEDYPSARGMGASASAIVAGLVAANHVGELKLADDHLAKLATRIEGHADNVLPALFGGLVLSAREGWLRFEPVDSLAPVILVAREKFKTEEARRVLPVEVPRADAVRNAASTAALVSIMTGRGSPEGLLVATEDRLHEPYRLPLMAETFELHHRLRSEGIAAALAGAGPSLVCIAERSRLDKVTELARSLTPDGWQVLTPEWDLAGAQVR